MQLCVQARLPSVASHWHALLTDCECRVAGYRRHLKTIHAPQEGIAKVTGICWSANNRRLAIVTTDRVVHLCDDLGERRDKFSTKPADPKGAKTYVVRGMSWSPDSSKLAVAQSDNIVFVYKLGHEWGDKKSICNKFQQGSSITCICWPESRPNELVFGLAEGKMKVGQLRSNKPATLYSTDSFVVACAHNPEGYARPPSFVADARLHARMSHGVLPHISEL